MGQSQELTYYGSRQGLSNIVVSDVVQDPVGFMWVGTENGLNRFDGHRFHIYNKESKPFQLPFNRVSRLALDSSGFLWIGHHRGLSRLNLQNYSLQNLSPQIDSLKVLSFLCSNSNTLFIGCDKGIIYRYHNNQLRKLITLPFPGEGKGVVNLVPDSGNTLLAFMDNQRVFRIDAGSGKLLADTRIPFYVFRVIHDRVLGALLMTGKGVYKLNRQNQLIAVFPKLTNVINLFRDKHSNLWATLKSNALYLYKNDTLVPYEAFMGHKDMPFLGPFAGYSQPVCEDKSGNLWLATSKGLIKIKLNFRFFERYFYEETAIDKGPLQSIRGILKDSYGEYYVGTNNAGLYKIMQDGKVVYCLGSPSSGDWIVPYAIAELNQKELLIATEGDGLLRYNKANNTFKRINEGKLVDPTDSTTYHWHHELGEQANGFLQCLLRDKDGTYWVGSYSGLFKYDPFTNKTSSDQAGIKITHGKKFKVHQFLITNDNHLLIASSLGLFELDENRKFIKNYYAAKEREGDISAEGVNGLCEDVNGLVWIATSGAGLHCLNRKTGDIIVYNTDNGLSDNNLCMAIVTKQQKLLISTYNGLSLFDPTLKQFTNFYAEDGLCHNEFNRGAYLYDRNSNQLFLGSIEGLIKFNPEAISNIKVAMNLKLASITLAEAGNKLVDYFAESPSNLNILELPYKYSYIKFNLFLSDFSNPRANIYMYKLGADTQWVSLGNQQELVLPAMAPGEYPISFKAAGANGNWSSPTPRLILKVLQPFWLTAWFWLLCSTLLFAISFMVYKYRIAQIKKFAGMRIDIASNLHDEVGSVLTRIAMQTELVKHQANEPIKPVLERISETCRLAVANMRDVIWSIDARNDQYLDVVDRMRQHINIMFEESDDKPVFHVNSEPVSITLEPLEKQALYLIFKEALNNSLKYGNQNTIHVSFLIHNSKILLRVENQIDTLKRNGSVGGSGLKNMQMRAEKMGASFTYTNSANFVVQVEKSIKGT